VLAALAITQMAACASNEAAAAPQRVAVEARPNGIAVRPDDGAVFLTDDTTGSILMSPDGHAFAHYAAILSGGAQGNSLSQLTFVDARTLLAERFGFGTAGAIFQIDGKDAACALTGPDPARRRLGLAAIGNGRALLTWFVKNGNQPAQGGLSLVTYDPASGIATERELLTGLGKPVGVVVSGKTVFVSDQANNTIVSAPLDALIAASQPSTSSMVASVSGPDLLAADGNGTLYMKCNKTAFCKITPDGTVSQIADGLQDARGAAIDETRHRLYLVDRAAAGGTSYVRILPLRGEKTDAARY
jgi:DNA-binding beta-propeller fold protein YncE